MEKLLTTKEAAQFFGVSANQIRRYVGAGLRCYEIGKGFRFDMKDLERWKERHEKIRLRYSRTRTKKPN